MDNRDEFINNNIKLVYACANKFRNKGIEFDDLVGAGNLGLVKAVDAFDESRNVKFSTYAVPVILGEIKCLFRSGGAVKVGRSLKELSLKIKKASENFLKKEGREPSINELATILSVDREQISEAMEASIVPISLTVEDPDGTNQIDIPVESHDEKVSELIALKDVVGKLPAKDRSIIILRFFKNQTQTQTAKVLGMTQVQVSRREKVILKELRLLLA